jgi:membrane protein YdbS with pleckstrin-like domain
MLSEQEKAFVAYWEKNRENEKKTFRQLLIGLPLGLSFASFILISFVSGWFERANMVAYSKFNPVVLVIAVLGIAAFTAIFFKKHKWDLNEQQYLELLAKKDFDDTTVVDAAEEQHNKS